MRYALLSLLAACGFHPAAMPTGGDDMPIDASVDTAIDGPAALGPCYVPSRNGLVLCLELDDMAGTGAVDGSGKGHDATIANVTMVTRDVPASSQAGRIITSSTIDAPGSVDFDLQQFTLELWVHREGSPGTGGIYGLIHDRAQYYMAIDDADEVECVIENGGNFTIATGPTLDYQAWNFATCTYDGAQLCPYVITPDGNAYAGTCAQAAITINTAQGGGITVGSITQANNTHIDHLAGELDSARVYSRALGVHEMCQGAGVTGC